MTTNFPRFEGDYYGSFIFNPLNKIAEKGHDVTVIAPHFKPAASREVMGKVNVIRFNWPQQEEFKPLMYFNWWECRRIPFLIASGLLEASKHIKRSKVDVICAEGVLPMGFMAVVLGKVFRKPVVVTSHGVDLRSFYKKPFFSTILRFTLKNSSRIIAVSDELKNYMLKLGIEEKDITIIPGGIDTQVFKPLEKKEEVFRVGFLGALNDFKNPENLLEAIPHLTVRIPKLEVLLAGDGPMRGFLESRAKKLGLSNKVRFLGFVDRQKVPGFLSEMDVMAFVSNRENFPSKALFESMASGVAVVATDVGYTKSLVKHNTNGLLTKPEPKEIAKAIVELYENEALRGECAKNARKTIIDKYSLESEVKTKIEILRKVLEEVR
ncbi:MAG: glycosyltransferase family 4 protein [Candidatus Altiarchaeota archaeon]